MPYENNVLFGGRTRARTVDPLIKSSAALPTELYAHQSGFASSAAAGLN